MLLAAGLLAGGCQGRRPTTTPAQALQQAVPPGLTEPHPLKTVLAVVTPPTGWHAEPLKENARHTHQVWISPSGRTAFGVIHFTLPLPLSADFILPFYLSAWRKDQGNVTLLSKADDTSLPGVRFVAEGGLYKTWSNLIVSGTQAWTIYAGVLRDQPVSKAELELAFEAREHTHVGLPPG